MKHTHCDNVSKAAASADTLLKDIRAAHSAACEDEPLLTDILLGYIGRAAELKIDLENLQCAVHRSVGP